MYTYYDCVSYLLDSTGGGAQDGYHRAIRSAVFNAYRDLMTARDWRWHETHNQIDIDQQYIAHTLPWGVQSVDAIEFHEPVGWDAMARYVTPRDFERFFEDSAWNEVVDMIWTIAPSALTPDRYDLRILNGHGYRQGKATLTYRRRPRDLRFSGWEPTSRKGTIIWNNEDAGSSGDPPTAFNQHMVGAVLRVSGDASYEPESLTGLHPYTDSALITEVFDSSSVRVWSPASVDYTHTKYIVTDYLDLSPGMYTALLTGAEYWLARLMGKDFQGVYDLYQRDLRIAFESDAVAVLTGRNSSRRQGYYYPFWYLTPGTDQGVSTPGRGGPNANGTCDLHPDVYGGSSSTAFDQCGGSTP